MAKAKEEKEVVGKNAMEALLEKMEKLYGKGVISYGNMTESFDTVSTGSAKLDKITACGGIPRGKLIEMFGPESSGKSTIALHIIAEFQKRGLLTMLVDYEHSFDKAYAERIGVDVDKMIKVTPLTMEDGYNIIYEAVKTKEIGLVVIDSHTAMVPKQRLDGQIGDAKMAPEARVNSDGLKKLKGELDRCNTTLLGISQLRANIGGMGPVSNVPTGGNAWKFYTDMRIKVYKQLDKVNESNRTTIEIVKNKCGKPYGKTEIGITWGIGIDHIQEIIELAVENGVIKQGGAWYTYADTKVQGMASLKELLNDNEPLFEEIKTLTLEKFAATELVVELTEEELKQIKEE